jgi:hypothetical protein
MKWLSKAFDAVYGWAFPTPRISCPDCRTRPVYSSQTGMPITTAWELDDEFLGTGHPDFTVSDK